MIRASSCPSDRRCSTLFFLFYFNRLFATLVSYGLRAYTWHNYRAYVDVQALQISFLGGRIFFKGLRYHGENETILVHSGYITWRYWLRSVKNVDCSRVEKAATSNRQDGDFRSSHLERSSSASGGERGGVKEVDDLPCRIAIKANGLEWFVYNRSPAYDSIVAAMQASEKLDGTAGGKSFPTDSSTSEHKSQPTKVPKDDISHRSFGLPSLKKDEMANSQDSAGGPGFDGKDEFLSPVEVIQTAATEVKSADSPKHHERKDPLLSALSVLPIWVNCQKAAMVLGNEHTRAIFTVTCDNAQGLIDAGPSGPLDQYKQIFDFEIKHPVVQMRPNHDFRHTQLDAAQGLNDANQQARGKSGGRHFNWRYHDQRHRIWHTFRDLVPYFQRSVDAFHPISPNSKTGHAHTNQGMGLPGETRWLGLTRYLDEDERDDHEGWDSVEYARFSTIVDCPSVNMRFFWDVPGTVPLSSLASPTGDRSKTASSDINGDEPPDWGLNLIVRGGIVNYGPWADRQRAEIQNVFFPSSYRDAVRENPLHAGAPRQATVFKVHVEIEAETTLRVPTREDSKDWQWKGRAEAVKGASTVKKQKEKKHSKSKKSDSTGLGPDIRPFGWFTVKVDPDSTVNYTMDMVASDSGYRNRMDLDLSGSTLLSSVNHGILWRSGRQSISCDLSNPLGWNELHEWAFNVESNDTEIFLLRDHMFLITDLVNDWTTGPGPEFYTFTPFKYEMNLRFFNFKLYLNCNDSNIINQPDDLDWNVFLVLGGKELDGNLSIPAVNYRPSQNALDFTATLQDVQMDLLTPVWNTQHTFLPDKTVFTLKHLNAKGRYSYCLSTSPALTDTLLLELWGTSPSLRLHGFVIRYFMKVKDNYFGDDLHFRTLEEFQDILAAQNGQLGTHPAVPHKLSNDLDVILKVRADRISALMPANLYSCKDTMKIDVNMAEADLRFTNYYMDLDATFSPLEASLKSFAFEDGDKTQAVSSPQLFVDGAHIYGHRLFGLPPTEPPYVCNWDFHVGHVSGECSSAFVRTLALAVKAFMFSLDDEENALPLWHIDPLHDITFLRLRLEGIRLWLLVEQAALLLSTGAIELKLDDWAGPSFSERLKIRVPDLTLAAVDRQSAARHRSKPHPPVTTHAYFQTTVDVSMIERKPNFAKDRHQQQHHVRLHDQRTRRTDFLLRGKGPIERVRANVYPPAGPYPLMPEPVMNNDFYRYTLASDPEGTTSQRSLKSKSSFLSLDSSHRSSLAGSVKRRSKNLEPLVSRTTAATGQNSAQHAPLWPGHGRRHYNESADGSLDRTAHGLPSDPERAFFGLPPSSVAYSSPWSSPYFPLDKVDPDLQGVPNLPKDIVYEQPAVLHDQIIDDVATETDEESSAHILFHVNCSTGLRGFCAPEFLHALACLVADMQPAHPVDVLDDLQITVMEKILNMGKSRTKPKHITDFKIRVPYAHVRMINSYSEAANPLQRQQDQYNLILSHTSATVRIREERDPNHYSAVHQQALVLHIVANSVSIGAQDHFADSLLEKVGVNGAINDLVFWLVSDQNISSRLQFRDFEVSMSSKKLEYLASMVYRTTEMANRIADEFQNIPTEQLKRLRHLAYALTMAGAGVPDPMFLIRPSYALRAAGDHLRTNDSWKIISRFRHIYESLAEPDRTKISDQCLFNSEACPDDGGALVVASFDQWRTWDLAHVKNSYVMEMIWGSIAGIKELHPRLRREITFSVLVGAMRFLLEPGSKQNEIYIQDLSQQLCINVPLKLASGMPMHISSSASTTAVQAYCSRIAFRLNWELCELVEDFLKLYLPVEAKIEEHHALTKSKLVAGGERYVHVIVGTDLGTISVNTVNLKVAMVGKGLKGSMVHRFLENNPDNKTTTLLLSSDAASTEILSQARVLAVSRLWQPNIYSSSSRQLTHGKPEEVLKLAGTCKKAQYEIREDVLGLLEIVNRVIEDEVEYIHSMISRFDFPPPRALPQDSAPPSKVDRRINVALFLDSYSITVALLPSLSYVISGAVARTSVAPTLGSKLAVDLDLKGHTHAFQSKGGEQVQSISLLHMPPINGRLVIDTSGDLPHVEVYATFERITLDAAALQGIISTVNRPEIEHVLTNVRTRSQTVKKNFNEVFGRNIPTPRIKVAPQTTAVLYRGYVTIAGFGIHATAPGLKNKNYSAHLDFTLGLVQLNLSNEGPQTGPALEYPEFTVRLRQIVFGLRRRENHGSRSSGRVAFGARITGSSRVNDNGETVPSYHVSSDELEVDLFAETASLAVDLAAYLQERFKSIDIDTDLKPLRNLRRLTLMEIPKISLPDTGRGEDNQEDSASMNLFKAMYSLELQNIRVSWIVGGSVLTSPGREVEDLVLSVRKIDLSTKKEYAARLGIEDLQLQLVPMHSINKTQRSLNSALLPEIVFNVAHFSTRRDRRFAFQAAGKALDLRLTSEFIVPASMIQSSIANASQEVREATAFWAETPVIQSQSQKQSLFSSKRLASLLVDADFAGAVVSLQGRRADASDGSIFSVVKGNRPAQKGRYGQFTQEGTASNATLRAPGIALKVEFRDNGLDDPSLNAEIKVDASTNVLYPPVVPLVMEISSSVKELVGESDENSQPAATNDSPQKRIQESALGKADPSAILGKCKLNIGLWICKQEFSLSCQPIARVSATAGFDDIFMTVNTVQSPEQHRFFSLLVSFNKLSASVQHVYSRESTASFDVESIVISLMNSKHISTANGISAILKVSPMKVRLNAKQLQDFLLFREIWIPVEIRHSHATQTNPGSQSQGYNVQRYQEVAAVGAFVWNATVAIAELDVQVDLGQALGKTSFLISNCWVSSKKSSDTEQNLCLGFEKIGLDSTGRMSGFVELSNFRGRTSIQWPPGQHSHDKAPLIQASLGFDALRVKAAFDYQPFLIADITSFEFLMYNIRDMQDRENDRLVGILDGGKVQVFCTTTSASQGYGLYQAVLRLVQEKQTAYEASLREIEKFTRRKSTWVTGLAARGPTIAESERNDSVSKTPVSLHTDVVVTLKALNIGAFPSTFFDNQIFKIEAMDAQARFAVAVENGKTHSGLGLTLGQLRVALAAVERPTMPKTLGDISVEDVVMRATGSKGGIILRVPKVVATMQTWQSPFSNHIDYIFKSAFEGKVDVGWNYSRISFIRGMWMNHSRTLAHRLGKPLPQSAVHITGGPVPEGEGSDHGGEEKITAVVNVPQSRYEYTALEPPIIETPQLRDMGEATPPLEWIGLHRDRLPNVTHQIIIVTLLEVAKEVEDAYSSILGSTRAT
jgi:hypothetical protein